MHDPSYGGADDVPVVVEKCFTITTEEADRVLAAQKKSGKVLSVFQSEYSKPI